MSGEQYTLSETGHFYEFSHKVECGLEILMTDSRPPESVTSNLN